MGIGKNLAYVVVQQTEPVPIGPDGRYNLSWDNRRTGAWPDYSNGADLRARPDEGAYHIGGWTAIFEYTNLTYVELVPFPLIFDVQSTATNALQSSRVRRTNSSDGG